MQSQIWQDAVQASADPNRADSYLAQLRQTSAGRALKKASADQARIVCALLSGSQASGELVLAHPDWLTSLLESEYLLSPRHAQGMRREIDRWLKPLLGKSDYAQAFARLREWKHREMLRVATRDLGRLADAVVITREISAVADVCVDAVFTICFQQLVERFGRPYHLSPDSKWVETEFTVLGMGKLGGQELNYSSDIDVIFVYSEEGSVFKTPPRPKEQSGKGWTNHQFFTKLSEAIVAEVGRMSSEGTLFRIDLRLRPEGNAGPLARSLESYESYYAQWGQTWERMMLIKARPVAGDLQLGAEFLEMINPFRYPHSLSDRTLPEVAAMKKRIESEVVKAGELDRNVKLGRGGIREIEFVAQTLQLLRGGRNPFLQTAQTLRALEQLCQYQIITPAEAKELTQAYMFLRDVEHRLQMEANQQTHTIPTERHFRERLARLMGFDTLTDFEEAHRKHAGNVRRIYEKILPGDEPESAYALPQSIQGNEAEWKQVLAEHSFRDVDKALRMLDVFINGPGYVHVSPRTMDLARNLLPQFLALCPKQGRSAANGNAPVAPNGQANRVVLSDPDRVLVRLDSFIAAYGARATLYELWSQNPSVFRLLLMLFDRSEFLAETAIRTPDLVDELELSGRLRRAKTAEETLKDLRYGLNDEDQRVWIRRYHQTEKMRIGLRDILGMADFGQSLVEISNLADACLQYALEVVTRKYGYKKPPFCIVGLGKLGGQEIDYGSDLDIIFVADSATRNLPALQRLAAEAMDLLSANTELGIAFHTDARLRPDGEKGLLVNTLDAYEEYYRKRAKLWEIQTLTRIRPIAGDPDTGEKYRNLAAALTNFTPENVASGFSVTSTGKRKNALTGLAAYTPEWKNDIARMRQRIEKERTPPGKEALAIKTGAGGLIDAEFMAQTFCLANGWQEPNTLKALTRAAESGVLESASGKSLIENYRQLHRVECILRRWSFEGEILLPDDPAPMYRVAVRCGFPDAKSFTDAVQEMRKAIRGVYKEVFS